MVLQPRRPASPAKTGQASEAVRQAIAEARRRKANRDATENARNLHSQPLLQEETIVASQKNIINAAIIKAKKSGRLDISNMELTQIPRAVYNMYRPTDLVVDFNAPAEATWFDGVELQTINGNDNALERLDDRLVDEFGGLISLSFRRNQISRICSNFRDLELLQVLDLRQNKLSQSNLTNISLPSLLELYLSHNQLAGRPVLSSTNLPRLRVLDLAHNEIDSVDAIELPTLEDLRASHNKLDTFPLLALSKAVALRELDVSVNNLKLNPTNDPISLPHLLRFNVSATRLTSLDKLDAPELRELYAYATPLIGIPSCNKLEVLDLSTSGLKVLPAQLFDLPLKRLDISGNQLTDLDARLGYMEDLEQINWQSNLIRSTRWNGLSTSEVKANLRNELNDRQTPFNATDPKEAAHENADAADVQSQTQLLDVPPLRRPLANHQPRSQLIWQDSGLLALRDILSIASQLKFLDFTNAMDTITQDSLSIDLPALEILKLPGLELTSLAILDDWSLPLLNNLDVSSNRLTDSSIYHKSENGEFLSFLDYLPSLKIIYLGRNKIETIIPEAFQGLEVIDLSDNAISRLPPSLGLVTSIRQILLEGNTFRFPKREIMMKGTGTLMAWLRDRIPT